VCVCVGLRHRGCDEWFYYGITARRAVQLALYTQRPYSKHSADNGIITRSVSVRCLQCDQCRLYLSHYTLANAQLTDAMKSCFTEKWKSKCKCPNCRPASHSKGTLLEHFTLFKIGHKSKIRWNITSAKLRLWWRWASKQNRFEMVDTRRQRVPCSDWRHQTCTISKWWTTNCRMRMRLQDVDIDAHLYQQPDDEIQLRTLGRYHEVNRRPIHTAETGFFPRLSANGDQITEVWMKLHGLIFALCKPSCSIEDILLAIDVNFRHSSKRWAEVVNFIIRARIRTKSTSRDINNRTLGICLRKPGRML